MFPAEFVRTLERNLNPRWQSCGVASTRFGAADRKFAGLDPHGTVWFANSSEREWDISIPADCIPYSSIKSAEWDEFSGRWKAGTGEMKRGWRSALEQLLESGHLRPSLEMTWLIGRDSMRITPKWFGGTKDKREFEDYSHNERYQMILAKYGFGEPAAQVVVESYGDGDAVQAKRDYREIAKEVQHYA